MYNQIETAKEFFKMSENVADPIIAINYLVLTLINDPAELRTFFILFH